MKEFHFPRKRRMKHNSILLTIPFLKKSDDQHHHDVMVVRRCSTKKNLKEKKKTRLKKWRKRSYHIFNNLIKIFFILFVNRDKKSIWIHHFDTIEKSICVDNKKWEIYALLKESNIIWFVGEVYEDHQRVSTVHSNLFLCPLSPPLIE